MKWIKKVIAVSVCFLFLGGAYLYADNSTSPDRPRGRDIAQSGKIAVVKGILKTENSEWVLLSQGKEYEIHMGPESYRASRGFRLDEGNQAVVKGFLLKTDIAVMEIESNGKSILLRDAGGRPAWAGGQYATGGNTHSDDEHDHGHGTNSGKNVPSELGKTESLENLDSM